MVSLPCDGLHDSECKDRDECADDSHNCAADRICRNLDPGFECVCQFSDGSDNCLSPIGAEVWVGELTAASAAALRNLDTGYPAFQTVCCPSTSESKVNKRLCHARALHLQVETTNSSLFSIESATGTVRITQPGVVFITYTQGMKWQSRGARCVVIVRPRLCFHFLPRPPPPAVCFTSHQAYASVLRHCGGIPGRQQSECGAHAQSHKVDAEGMRHHTNRSSTLAPIPSPDKTASGTPFRLQPRRRCRPTPGSMHSFSRFVWCMALRPSFLRST